MKRTALLLLAACGAALAQDHEPLLARLEKETRALAGAAESALVTVTVEAAPPRVDLRLVPGEQRVGVQHFVFARQPAAVSGVLVGTPARVVVPFHAVEKAKRVTVTLGDGREAEAQRLDGDPELGVAVFALPAEVAGRAPGLKVEGDWARLAPGSLAVPAGAGERGLLGLTLVRSADPRLGTVAADEADAPALLGTRRTLLGLRATSADWSSCRACHLAAGDGAVRLAQAARAAAGARRALAGPAGKPLADDPFFTVNWPARAAAHRLEEGGGYIAGPVIGRVLDDIEAHGRIRFGYLGVVLGDTAGQGKEAGVTITAVMEGSPAQAAGLKVGQRVAAVDGLACPSTAMLSRALVMRRPGEEVTLTLAPDEEKVTVRLADRDDARGHFVTAENVGVECVEIGSELRTYLQLEADVRGVVVFRVKPDSPAAAAGVRKDDVITWGGGGAITDLEELAAALASAKGSIELRGLRAGAPFTATVNLD